MTSPAEINSNRAIARAFAKPWHRHYSASKIKSDPLYEAVWEVVQANPQPLLDIGCGLGLLAFSLRARGYREPVMGFDYDASKIADALHARESLGYPDLHFQVGDAREHLPEHRGHIAILDVLQFLDATQQRELLNSLGTHLAPGATLIIRSGLAAPHWRFRLTRWGDYLAKATLWMKAFPVHYPSESEIRDALEPLGLQGHFQPLWGKTPFHNYLITFSHEPRA